MTEAHVSSDVMPVVESAAHEVLRDDALDRAAAELAILIANAQVTKTSLRARLGQDGKTPERGYGSLLNSKEQGYLSGARAVVDGIFVALQHHLAASEPEGETDG